MTIRVPLFAIAAVCFAAGSALAVKPGQWVHDTEAAFGSASLDQTVVTNLGRVELSRASEKIAELTGDATIIYDMVSDSTGATYLAIGPTGELATLDADHKIQSLANYPDEQVFALATDGPILWVAISGKTCKLEKREAGKIIKTITVPDIRYIWDVVLSDGKLILATGTDGKVLVVDPNDLAEGDIAKSVTALDCEQDNVLCLGMDGRKRIYAGTDTEGLIYRLTPADDKEHPYSAYVMYDAPEPEIGAMLVMPDGTVYAGTADADQAKPGRLKQATEEEQGKPAPAVPTVEPTEQPGEEPGKKPEPTPIPKPPEKPEPPLPPKPKPQSSSATTPAPETPGNKNKPDQKEPADVESSHPLSLPMTETAVALAETGEVPADTAAASDKPTKAQYDKLRVLISKRLLEARKAGSLAATKAAGAGATNGRIGPRRANTSPAPAAANKPGNAVYRISPDGFVSEVFRESVMILRLAMVDDKLIIATGNEGQIYRTDPTGQEVTVLADLESQQVPAMLEHNGEILIGTANPAVVARLNSGYAHTGTFTADPLDASQISRWGALCIVADLPEHTGVKVATRSGNVADPDAGFWSKWSTPVDVKIDSEGQPFFAEVASPSARFIQYKLTLDSSDGQHTPSVSLVSLKYLMPNLAPRIASLRATYPQLQLRPDALPQAQNMLNVEWDATDPNSDAMSYTLAARKLGTDQPFVTVADDLHDTTYAWNTLTMPEGRYELRITADDSPDNVPDQAKTAQRLSAPIVIDNSAPQISDLAAKPVAGKPGSFTLTAEISDKMSIIADIRYSVSSSAKSDAQPTWNVILPVDQIDDSTNERVSFTIPPLTPGVRVLTLRATDAQGNTVFQSTTVNVPKP